MPEYVIILFASMVVGSFGWVNRRVDHLSQRVDRFDLKAAETYVTKDAIYRLYDTIQTSLNRMEDKLDAHMVENRKRIDDLRIP